MLSENKDLIESAKKAALEILIHNSKGPFLDLPRTAGWGYPEPYTRDLSISILGITASKNPDLINSMRSVLQTLAKNQSEKGQIPSLVHDKNNLGSSDTTPLFLMAVGIFRKMMNDPLFLKNPVEKALLWMEYQCPKNDYLIAQQPTSDWRDEQWVLGYGLFVNSIAYTGLKLLGQDEHAKHLGHSINQPTYNSNKSTNGSPEGLALHNKPYYALWSYKVYSSDRFDLLGNSIAILSGLASESKANLIVEWIETECASMQKNKILAFDLTPNLFPFIEQDDADWLPRYSKYNLPGDYHNGGIWPFITGFYIAALVAAKKYNLAESKLMALTKLVKKAKNKNLEFGFNEWYKAQDGQPMGVDWQTWSASNYLFAAQCVAEKRTPFFDDIRY